ELLAKVVLPVAEYGHRLPSELSGGEQQRVGIVRAMIGQPKIFLMDEPFSALDAISRKQLQVLTKELHKEFGMTTIFVTHDTDEALKLADRIAVLQDGEIRQVTYDVWLRFPSFILISYLLTSIVTLSLILFENLFKPRQLYLQPQNSVLSNLR
ncbi:ATP-binding cassette domain-containing protein, partial [Stenotrophomonas acidaminiphila]|nr:ATP-binding cassette domain-containing protein [Stenotrophomonas acidaminiphila]